MKKLSFLLVLFIVLILGLLFAASRDERTETKPEKSGTEQSQSVSGRGKLLHIPGRFVNTDGFKQPKTGDPVEMAYEFFELNQEEFHITNPREELVYKGTTESKLTGTRAVHFEQVYQGVPVHRGSMHAQFTPSGELEVISGNYHYDFDLSTTPQIDSAAAWNIALEDLGFPEGAKVVNSQYRSEFFKAESLMFEQGGVSHPDYNARFEGVATRVLIWRSEQDGKYHLVWKVCIDPKAPRQVSPSQLLGYYIDAHDGTILEKQEPYSRSYMEKWGH
jgi:Zn-dependent metalloprotease